MKEAVVYFKDTYNIGDDIQTLAAKRLLPNAKYLDREELHNYNGEKKHLLCNGYFMRNPKNWPPSSDLIPYFISFHISAYKGSENYMLRPELRDYYNRFGPVGCRDMETKRRLDKIGVDAYYSSCLTLTLERNPEIQRSNKILFADAFLKMNNTEYERFMIRKMVPDSLKDGVDFYRHDDHSIAEKSIEERMNNAQKALDLFSSASLVFTSRIHCALPCLALGTPVYFMDLGYDRPEARKRFEGILDMMQVLDQKYFAFSSNKPYSKLLRRVGLYKYTKGESLDQMIDWDHAENSSAMPEFHRKEILNRIKNAFQG